MCDLKAGDDVIFIGADGVDRDMSMSPPRGWAGRVVEIIPDADPRWPEVMGLLIDSWPLPPDHFHNHELWRKALGKDEYQEPLRVAEKVCA